MSVSWKGAREVFKNGGSGVFTCSKKQDRQSLRDVFARLRLCACAGLSAKVTAAMLDRADLAGMSLKSAFWPSFAVYAVWLVMGPQAKEKARK